LFASTVIDYDYIIGLIAKYTQSKPSKQKMSREQLINLLSSSSNLLDEKDDIVEYINQLETGKSLSEKEIRNGYEIFKSQKIAKEVSVIAEKQGIDGDLLKKFVEEIMSRMIFDGEKLSDLLEPLELGWKMKTKKELSLMEDLVPLLKKLAHGREISGLAAYE